MPCACAGQADSRQTSVYPSPEANCPTKYMRSTLNAVPTTNSLLKKSKLPFALVIQPYAALHDAEDPIPVIPDQVISRCRRCRSYINPFVTFLDHGHRWRCNMCNLTNDVPQAFDWDSTLQKPADRSLRADLNHSMVEFVAPQEYMVRPPQPLVYLFLIDVSYASVTNGLLATTARTIKESLDRIPNADRRTRLGFVAVDSSLHYFSIPRDQSGTSDPRMLVVSDLDEPFLPIPGDLLVTLSECRENIEIFLDKLQEMFQNTQNNSCAMGSALRAGYKLISPVGGKMTVLSSSLPNIGHGALTMREDKKVLGTSKESSLLQTGNSFYKSFAVECSKAQVSVDMFLFSSQYQDVASLSCLPRYTGGQTYFYPAWNAARSEDAIKFAREFSDYLSSEIGLEAVLRVRATTGLRMSTFYGNFFNRSSDLCAFPAFPRDQAYVVEVAIDETVTKPVVCMQAAVLHTTCNGERRIRVLTVALPTTQNLTDVYASADQQAIATFFSHKAVERTLSSGLDPAREALQAKIVELLQTYRKELAGGSVSGGGLQFPANLRALPVLFLAMIKNVSCTIFTFFPLLFFPMLILFYSLACASPPRFPPTCDPQRSASCPHCPSRSSSNTFTRGCTPSMTCPTMRDCPMNKRAKSSCLLPSTCPRAASCLTVCTSSMMARPSSSGLDVMRFLSSLKTSLGSPTSRSCGWASRPSPTSRTSSASVCGRWLRRVGITGPRVWVA